MCMFIIFWLFTLLMLLVLLCFAIRIYAKLTAGRCKSNTCLVGKTALVTGGNAGIGYQTALGLAARGCRVIIADIDNCNESQQKIIEATGNKNIVAKHLDLASFASVRKLAKDINATEERLDILINNAGTVGLRNAYTEDDLHMGMQVNHFGPFLLTHLLIGLLKKSAPSRIIFVSSDLAFINNLTLRRLNIPKGRRATLLTDILVYANSKLCNIITTNILSKKLYGTGVTSNSVHPGVVNTSIWKKYTNRKRTDCTTLELIFYGIIQFFGKDAEAGAQCTLHVAMAKELEKVSGRFFAACQLHKRPYKSKDKLFAWKIWDASEQHVKLSSEEKL